MFFDIYPLESLYLNINSEQWRIIPNNILNIKPFWGFFIQTLIVNKDEFSKIRFLYFWNIGQHPLEFTNIL
jgi:hypothetical protein